MTARDRNYVTNRYGGTADYYWASSPHSGGSDCFQSSHSIGDHISLGDCMPLTVNHVEINGGVIDKEDNNYFGSWMQSYVADALRSSSFIDHVGISDLPSVAEVSTQGAAATNPSRPYVDVPVDVFDVRAGIQRIHDAGRSLISRFGGNMVEQQFLVRPMVSDIVKLLNTHEQVDRRVQEVRRLAGPKGFRRTIQIGVYSATETNTSVLQSERVFVTRSLTRNTVCTVSCHTRWRAASSFDFASPEGLRNVRAMALHAVQGATIDFSTLWEIMPWSWALDWFGNMGTYLRATRNIIPALLTDVCPMYHTVTTTDWPGGPVYNGSITGGNARRETKQRFVGFVAPVAHFGFLDGSQVSLLASLAAARSH